MSQSTCLYGRNHLGGNQKLYHINFLYRMRGEHLDFERSLFSKHPIILNFSFPNRKEKGSHQSGKKEIFLSCRDIVRIRGNNYSLCLHQLHRGGGQQRNYSPKDTVCDDRIKDQVQNRPDYPSRSGG